MNIWIDIENLPNVLFFEPIIREFKQRGHKVFVTARDYVQLLDLLDLYSIDYIRIGHHYGKNKLMKIIGGGIRGLQLFLWTLNKKIDVGVGFGMPSIVLACRLGNIPHITIYDYGYHFIRLVNKCADRIIIPSAIPTDFVVDRGGKKEKIVRFPGTKEEVYARSFKPHTSNNLLRDLGIDSAKAITTIRPPAVLAHYHNEESEVLFEHLVNIIGIKKDVIGIVFPRTKAQLEELSERNLKNIYVLEKPVNGLELIWNSDLVISGGGTMIREAAALGIPAYSIFTGVRTWVGKELARKGKIKFVDNINDLNRIPFKKRERKIDNIHIAKPKSEFLIDFFIREIESFGKTF